MRKNKKNLVVGLAVVMSLGLVACGSSSVEETENVKPTLAISHHPYIHALPTVYADQNGMYDEFDYEITMYSGGPTQNEAISSDSWEVGTTGMGGGILGIVGYNMKVIGFTVSDSPTTDLWVRPDSPLLESGADELGIIGSAEDWKNTQILCPTGTTQQMTLIGTLQHLGVSYSDVSSVDMSFAQCFSAFKAGEGDITVLGSPYGHSAEREGWVKVSSAEMLGIQSPCLIIATEKAVNEKPEVIQAWLEEFLAASVELNKDREASGTMLYEFQRDEGIKGEEEDAIADLIAKDFPELDQNKEWFTENENGVTEAEEVLLVFADFLISQGKLEEADKQKMLDNNFIDNSFIMAIE